MNRPLLTIARHLGMGLHRPAPLTPFWDGRALDRDILDEAPNPSTLLAHEIGHNLCAAPARRRVPNYGLGPTARDLSDAPLLVGARAAAVEESNAAIVGNVVLAWCAPAELAESLEETTFVAQREDTRRWFVTSNTRRLLQRAMRCDLLGTCAIPVLCTPHVLVDFLCTNANELLAPLLGEARP